MNAFETFTNSKTGEKISLRFREFTSDDVAGFIDCIRDEYGETYWNPDVYEPEKIIEDSSSEQNKYFVAESKDGKIVAVLALKKSLPRENYCEICYGITSKQFRNFGIMRRFFTYVLEQARSMKNIYAEYCSAVLYHDITSKLLERVGFVPTGFEFSQDIIEGKLNSFDESGNVKRPYGILIRAVDKIDAGSIFLPRELSSTAEKIYRDLNVNVEILNRGSDLNSESKFFFTYDEPQKNCEIEIDSPGYDLREKIESIQNQFRDPDQTFNIYLNVSHSGAVDAYKILRDMKYFCTGFKPICSDREILIMHNAGNVSVDLYSLSLTEKFSALRDFIINGRN